MVLTLNNMYGGLLMTISISFKDMQQRVKEETSHFAIRQRDVKGDSLFEDYVLDEGDETRFGTLFYSAQAELETYVCAYTKRLPVDDRMINTSIENKKDYVLQLLMPRNFNHPLARSTGLKIERFIENHIIYEWLETKNTQAAQVYALKAQTLESGINADLNKRCGGIVRPNVYY
jgi:hypothetical protein